LAFIDQSRVEMQLVRDTAEDAEYQSLMDKLNQDLGPETINDLQCGAANSDLEEIIGLISRMRGKRAHALTGWASLAKTERRVVSLATEGLSNPQIAERMFIARGTVKVHLSHIYGKPDVASRTQLATKALTENFGSD
jgi:DNA-binding NarL/FixJ family response regulator